MREIIALGGLPRSGSTLLCNILHQNPEFHVTTAASGFIEVLNAVMAPWDTLLEHKAAGIDEEQKRRVLEGVYETYHSTECGTVIDKSRAWPQFIELHKFVTGKLPKVIVPVRSIPEILASLEKMFRNSKGKSNWMFRNLPQTKYLTVGQRCDLWAASENVLGMAYNRILDACDRGFRDCLHFVEFDALTSMPKDTMQRLYAYLGKPYFEHDFTNIDQVGKEDDLIYHGYAELHTIRPKIEVLPLVADAILTKPVAKKFRDQEFWRG